MPRLWDLCTDDSRRVLKELMKSFGADLWDPDKKKPRRPDTEAHGKLEDEEKISKIMTIVPGFDQGAE